MGFYKEEQDLVLVLVAIQETISKLTKMDFSLKFILLTYLIISIEGRPQNHTGGQSHNGGIEGNNGNFVSNIGDNAKHNTEFGSTQNFAAGGQGTFNAPVNRGNLSGNQQQNFGGAKGSQVPGGVKAETITGFNGK